MDRRSFLKNSAGLIAAGSMPNHFGNAERIVITVSGNVPAEAIGNTLIHEHILVDFIGATQYNTERWNDDAVVRKVLPYLTDLKASGCNTLVDCTPNYLGRDVVLLKRLGELSQLNIVTNTGYYGGSDNKYLPAHAFTETAGQLAARWINEWEHGIDGTGIKPGFIKTSVNSGRLSAISGKLVRAAALTHRATGLTIASHTGAAIAAFEEIEILKQERVAPDAFIWVHAQNESDKTTYLKAARLGAWVSLDGLSEENINDYVSMVSTLKKENCLQRTLLSHDAGWYQPDKPDAEMRGYTVLFRQLIPALLKNGFSTMDIDQLIRINPAEAFTIRVRT